MDESCDGIAAVTNLKTGTVSGMAIVISETEVITCSHVINEAVGRKLHDTTPLPPSTEVEVIFPILSDMAPCRARVERWLPPDERDQDCALLRLQEPIPSDCGIAKPAVFSTAPMTDDALSILAISGRDTPGGQIDARFNSRISKGWAQITNAKESIQIFPGCSGAAVWNKDKNAVVGMVAARASGNGINTLAYVIPFQTIADTLGLRHIETRTCNTGTHKMWILLSLLLFVFMLFHYLPTNSSDAFHFPWTKGSEHLSAFFGLHFYALLSPLTLYFAFQHARSFRNHPWPARVPPWLSLNPFLAIYNTGIGAFTTLLFLVLLPFVAQVLFLRFLFLGRFGVWIYPEKFDLQKSDPSLVCPPAKDICYHPSADIWRLIWGGPYRDNAYRIGTPELTDTVTFFPVLQPALLLGLTLLSSIWLLRLLGAILLDIGV